MMHGQSAGQSGKLQTFLAKQALRGLDAVEARLNPLRIKLQADPYYRFKSFAEVAAAVKLGVYIDANQATLDDWLRLPGFSIHQARTLAELTVKGLNLTCLDDIAATLGISVQRILPLEPILRFCYYDQASAVQVQLINVNQANLAQLQTVPVIDQNLGRFILYDRQLHGHYRNWVDLKQRLRLSPRVMTALLHYLRF